MSLKLVPLFLSYGVTCVDEYVTSHLGDMATRDLMSTSERGCLPSSGLPRARPRRGSLPIDPCYWAYRRDNGCSRTRWRVGAPPPACLWSEPIGKWSAPETARSRRRPGRTPHA